MAGHRAVAVDLPLPVNREVCTGSVAAHRDGVRIAVGPVTQRDLVGRCCGERSGDTGADEGSGGDDESEMHWFALLAGGVSFAALAAAGLEGVVGGAGGDEQADAEDDVSDDGDGEAHISAPSFTGRIGVVTALIVGHGHGVVANL